VRITLKKCLNELGFELDACGSGLGPVAGSCEQSNEPSGSIRRREFLDKLSDYELLKEESAPW
jgi:hypothetical protein